MRLVAAHLKQQLEPFQQQGQLKEPQQTQETPIPSDPSASDLPHEEPRPTWRRPLRFHSSAPTFRLLILLLKLRRSLSPSSAPIHRGNGGCLQKSISLAQNFPRPKSRQLRHTVEELESRGVPAFPRLRGAKVRLRALRRPLSARVWRPMSAQVVLLMAIRVDRCQVLWFLSAGRSSFTHHGKGWRHKARVSYGRGASDQPAISAYTIP